MQPASLAPSLSAMIAFFDKDPKLMPEMLTMDCGRKAWVRPRGPPITLATGTVVAATPLTALDSDAGRGEASAVQTDDTFAIRVSASELGDAPGVHEVWLINVDGKRMISIGLLASGDEGDFAVPMDLIDEGYRIVDISVEPDDGDPTHSGVSIARGELA